MDARRKCAPMFRRAAARRWRRGCMKASWEVAHIRRRNTGGRTLRTSDSFTTQRRVGFEQRKRGTFAFSLSAREGKIIRTSRRRTIQVAGERWGGAAPTTKSQQCDGSGNQQSPRQGWVHDQAAWLRFWSRPSVALRGQMQHTVSSRVAHASGIHVQDWAGTSHAGVQFAAMVGSCAPPSATS